MKNYLIILLSLFILGCNNKPAEKVEKVGSDPVTVRLVVHNQTGADMKAKATYCVDKANCEYVIKAGESLTMESNTHAASGTVFMFWPAAPEKADGSGPCDPATGTAQQTYGYWNGSTSNKESCSRMSDIGIWDSSSINGAIFGEIYRAGRIVKGY